MYIYIHIECVCVCIYIYIYMANMSQDVATEGVRELACVHVCMFVCVCMDACMFVCMCMYVYTCIYIYIHVCVYVYLANVRQVVAEEGVRKPLPAHRARHCPPVMTHVTYIKESRVSLMSRI